jgi:hypothetical protein
MVGGRLSVYSISPVHTPSNSGVEEGPTPGGASRGLGWGGGVASLRTAGKAGGCFEAGDWYGRALLIGAEAVRLGFI